MDLKKQLKKEGGKFQFEGPTIIYCPTKKKTEEVTNALKGTFCFCLKKRNKINVPQSRKWDEVSLGLKTDVLEIRICILGEIYEKEFTMYGSQ